MCGCAHFIVVRLQRTILPEKTRVRSRGWHGKASARPVRSEEHDGSKPGIDGQQASCSTSRSGFRCCRSRSGVRGTAQGTVLAKPDELVEHVYFLTRGIGSVIAVTSEGRRVEAGLFGFDGYAPAHVAAGVRLSPHEVVIQVEAGGYRMTFDQFQRALEASRNFRLLVNRCGRFHCAAFLYCSLQRSPLRGREIGALVAHVRRPHPGRRASADP